MIPLNSNLSTLKRSPIRLFTNMARETPGCAMLTIGEPDFDTPENIREAAVAAIRENHTHYAPNQGTPALRQAVAEFETGRGNPTRPEQVLITIGACHALFTALLGILNPGEEIIVPTPGFMLYESIATIAGAKTVPLDTAQSNRLQQANDQYRQDAARVKALYQALGLGNLIGFYRVARDVSGRASVYPLR